MRFGFPQMVIASLVLHTGVIAGLVLPHSPAHPVATGSAIPTNTPSLYLLSSEAVFTQGQAAKSPPAAQPLAVDHRPTVPSPAHPAPRKDIKPAPTAAQSFALEAKAKAQLRSLPPMEAVLAPHPAPQLDGQAGIVFLLDVSGSMVESYAGSTRLALAREALARHLEALPEGTPFAVILYAERSKRSGPLVAANASTREAAVRFIRSDADCGGGTNLPDGLAWAVQLQTGYIEVITDGDLNTTIPSLLAQAGRILGPKGRCPALTIVGIAPRPDETSSLILQSLARQQGGIYQSEEAELLTANHPSPTSTP